MTDLARRIRSLLFLSNQPVTEIAPAEACEVELEQVPDAVIELGDLAPDGGLILRRVGGAILASDPESGSGARRLLSKPRTPPLTQAPGRDALRRRLPPASCPAWGDRRIPRRFSESACSAASASAA